MSLAVRSAEPELGRRRWASGARTNLAPGTFVLLTTTNSSCLLNQTQMNHIQPQGATM